MSGLKFGTKGWQAKLSVRGTIGLVLSVSIVALLVSGSVIEVSAGVTAVTIDHPGTYGEDDDYFTVAWGNPRDMSDSRDLYLLNASCGSNPARAQWSSTWYADGIWHGVTSSVGDTRYVFVLNPGWVSSLDTGEDGELRPLDTSRYRQLSFRMRVANGAGYHFPAVEWADTPIGAGAPRGRRAFQIQSDGKWHIYTMDLGSDSSWTQDPVSSLWIQLESLNAGYLVEIDWIRLTPTQSRQISWVGDPLAGTANVYFSPEPSDPEAYGDLLIYDGLSPRSISAGDRHLAVTASLPPGTYYGHVKVEATRATSADAWTFLSTPIARIAAPSVLSGEDFATSVVGNPWDMSGIDDVDIDSTKMNNIKSLAVEDGVLTIVTRDDGMDSCAAPWPHRPLGLNLGDFRIDTTRYRYLSYRYKVDNAPEQGAGGVTRVRWQARHLQYWPTGRTDDISLYTNDWETFSVDLPNVDLEVEMGTWGDFEVDPMQILIHESHREWTSQLDWVKLTAENVAQDSYAVQWAVIDASLPLTTTLYWAEREVDGSYLLVPGTKHVISAVPSVSHTLPYEHNLFVPILFRDYDAASGVQLQHEFSTVGLVNGERYYVAIKLEDGYSVSWWYSEVPVLKQ